MYAAAVVSGLKYAGEVIDIESLTVSCMPHRAARAVGQQQILRGMMEGSSGRKMQFS